MNKQIVILTVLGLLMLAGCKKNDDDITAKTEISAEIVEETSVSAAEEAAKTVTKEADTEEQKAEEPKETEKSADTEETQEAEAVNAEKSEEVADAEKSRETVDEEAITFQFPNEAVKGFVEQTVVLSENTMMEAYEWVKESQVLRVRVQYKEQPEDNYLHKEDYFFFFANGEIVETLYVDYPSKDFENMDKPRYVAEACDFGAHMEDVTFDGREDLIISLGYGGSATFACAYIATEDGFKYNQSFEEIPSYEVDVQEQVIRGSNTHNAVSYSEYEYRYENESFVLKTERNFEYSEATEQHELAEEIKY